MRGMRIPDHIKANPSHYEFPFTLGSRVPESVYLDVTNVCNIKCTMCPQGHDKVVNKGFISKKLFCKILDDLSELKPRPRLAFHLIGEPFMHKDIFEFISTTHGKGIYTFLHTNGTLLDEEKCKRIVKSGLSEITFSFEGEDARRYNEIRKGSNWKKVVNNMQYLLGLTHHPKVIVEVLKFRGIDKGLEINGDFKDMFPSAWFHSYFASNWRGTLNDDSLWEKKDLSKQAVCRVPLCDMAIGWDGIVKACSIDYNSEYPLGNLSKEGIMDIWLGEKRKGFLERINNRDYESVIVCRNCNAPYYAHEKERKWVK